MSERGEGEVSETEQEKKEERCGTFIQVFLRRRGEVGGGRNTGDGSRGINERKEEEE